MSLIKIFLGSALNLASCMALAQAIDNQALWDQDPASDHVLLAGQYTLSGSFRSDKPILINGFLELDVLANTALHLGGNIANAPGVGSGIYKLGDGTLVLSGTNTYGGVTDVAQGTLRVASSSALGAVGTDLIMAGGTTLIFDPGVAIQRNLTLGSQPGGLQWRVDSGMAEHSGFLNLVGFGSTVHKQGSGVLRLAGNGMGFGSRFVVEQGGLMVDGSFVGAVQVQEGAWLQGGGWVDAAHIQQGGALMASGALPGLSVTNTLRFDPGSRFVVDVAAAGHAAPVTVGGQAHLAGRVRVRTDDVAATLWPASWEYPVLHALGGFDDTLFDGADVNVPFLTAGLRYDANHVYLQLGLAPQAKQSWPFSGSWGASLLSGLSEDSRFVRQSALRHVKGSRSGPFFWADAFYSHAERGARVGVPGDRRDLSGVVVGMQQSLGESWRVNGFFGMQHGVQRRRDGAMELAGMGELPVQASASARVNSVHAGVSAAWKRSGMELAVGVAHTWHGLRSRRSVAVGGLRDAPEARFHGRTVQVFSELSANVLQRPRSSISPFARLAWVQTRVSAYAEQGGPAALRFDAARQGVLFSTLGLRAEHELHTPVGQARVYGTLGWRHAAGSVTPRSRVGYANGTGSGTVVASGLPVSRNAAVVQLGVTATLGKGVSLSMGYAGQHGRGYQDHGLSLGAQLVF